MRTRRELGGDAALDELRKKREQRVDHDRSDGNRQGKYEVVMVEERVSEPGPRCERRPDVQHEHRLTVAVAQVHQAVMDVLLVGGEHVEPSPPTRTSGGALPIPATVAAPSTRPSSIAPESPMKMRAGWKLCLRNPRDAPTITMATRGADEITPNSASAYNR